MKSKRKWLSLLLAVSMLLSALATAGLLSSAETQDAQENVLWQALQTKAFDYWGQGGGALNDGVGQTKVEDVDFATKFGDTETTVAWDITLKDMNNLGNFYLYGNPYEGVDFTQYTDAYLLFYAKLPVDYAGVTLTVRFWGSDWMSAKNISVDLAGGGEWQRVAVPLTTAIMSMANFQFIQFQGLNSGKGFENGDVVSFAGLRVVEGTNIPGGGEEDEPDQPGDDDVADKETLWSCFNEWGFEDWGEGGGAINPQYVTQTQVTADFTGFGDTETTKAWEVTLKDMNNLGKFYLYDLNKVNLSKCSDVTLSFYIKTPRAYSDAKFVIELMDSDKGNVKRMEIGYVATGEWQKIEAKLPYDAYGMSEFQYMLFWGINTSRGYQNGDVVSFAGMKLSGFKAGDYDEGEPDQPGDGDDGEKETVVLWQALQTKAFDYWGQGAGALNDGVGQTKVEGVDFATKFGDTQTTVAWDITLKDMNNLGAFYLYGDPYAGVNLTQYDEAYLYFYAKLPAGHAGATLSIGFLEADWMTVKTVSAELAGGGEWQKIVVPLTEDVLSLDTYQFIRVTGINANNFKNGDVISLAGLRIMTGTEIPGSQPGGGGNEPDQPGDDGEDLPDAARKEKVVLWKAFETKAFDYWGQNVGALNDGVGMYKNPVNFIESFGDANTTVSYDILLKDMNDLGKFYVYGGSNDGYDYWQPIDLTKHPNATLSFYFRMPEGPDKATISISFVSSDWMTIRTMSAELSKSAEWQKVVMPLSADVMKLTNYQFLWFKGIDAEHGFENNDMFSIAGMQISVERPVFGSEDEVLEDIPVGYGEVERPLWQSFTSGAKDESGSNDAVGTNKKIVTTTPKFCGEYPSAVQMVVVDAANMGPWNFFADSNTPKTVDLTRDFDKAYVTFYVKTSGSATRKLDVYLYGEDGTSCVKKTVTIPGGDWQKVGIKLSTMEGAKLKNFSFMRLVWQDGAFSNGDTVDIAGLRLYANEVVSMLDTLYEDDLSKYTNPYYSEAEVLFSHTATDEATIEGVASKIDKTADKKGEYFDFARAVTVGAIEPGTSWKTVLSGKAADLSAVWKTAALRVFMKSPKANTYVNVGLIDKNGTVMNTSVFVERANVWQEIQIRPNAMRVVENFDKSAVVAVFVGNEYSVLHADELLEDGQTLLIGGVEIYSDSPVRKLSDDTVVEATAQANSSNIVKMSFGTYGGLFAYGKTTVDFNNKMDGKNTWRVDFTEDSDEGFQINIPFARGENSDVFKKYGYISFACIAEGYVSMNLVITDGTKTYTQAVDMTSEWTELIIFAQDLAAAGVDLNKVSFFTLERNRKVLAGTTFNFTEFTKASDVVEIPYVYEGTVYDWDAGEDSNLPSGDDNSDNPGNDNIGDSNLPGADAGDENEGGESPVTGVAYPVAAFVTLMMAGVAVLMTRMKKAERK